MSLETAARGEVAELISQCVRCGVRMSLDGERLRIQLPEGGIDPTLVSLIKENKAGLMRALGAARAQAAKAVAPPIRRAARPERLPLSYGQEGMWLGAEFADVGDMSHLTVLLRLDGALKVAALEAALEFIVARHAPLRTHFRADERGRPYQVVQAPGAPLFERVDASRMAAEALEHTLQQLHRRPFRLGEQMPCRAALLALKDDSHIFMFTTHHISSDGWSIGVLMREIGECYDAAASGRAPALPPLEVEYPDYTLWQGSVEESTWFREGRRYWRERLEDPPALHGLPLDRPRPSVQSYSTERLAHGIDRETLRMLEACALKCDTTLFVLLISAFGMLVHRYSGDEDVIIGTPIANRLREEIAPLIGLFMNVLIMRQRVRADERVADVIARTRAHYLKDLEYQGIPIERVAEDVARSPTHSGHAPLVRLSFVLQNNVLGAVALEGLQCRTEFILPGASAYELSVSAHETSDGLHFDWQYNTGLFDESRIKRMSRHFENLLRDVARSPGKRVGELDVVSEAERRALLALANDSSTVFDPDLSFDRLFERQVASQPDNAALYCGAERFSYRELNDRANQLAHWLLRRGRMAPDAVVGICLERSADLVVALLAVAKAGAAYLPLDPGYPAARLDYMMEHARAVVVIASGATMPVVVAAREIVCLDDARVRTSLGAQPLTNPEPEAGQRRGPRLAYVIYTSGSTGRPKGVMIEHRSLTNFLLSMQREPGFGARDVVLAVTTPSFDIHTLELFGPLISGGAVVVAGPHEYADAAALARLIDAHAVSIVQATPATWLALVDYGWSPRQPIKALCGGEALTESLKEKLVAQPKLTLWNMYGPTETCVWSAVKKIEDRVLIGAPIANTRLYVLDDALRPSPLGVEGDLYIAGDGLARGYAHEPELTEAAFLTTLPAGVPETRLYRTGDRVIRLECGDLVFMGRRDAQVKLNGFRIETSEVAAAIESIDEVRQAAVVMRQRADRSHYLAAFVVMHTPGAWAAAAFAGRLRRLLPHYMIPAVFECVEGLPKTPNGKVDFKQLAARPLAAGAAPRPPRAPPETTLQKSITALWADLLNVDADSLGLDDDLLASGADSIRVLMFVGRARKLGLAVDVQAIYRSPTVRSLAVLPDRAGEQQSDNLYAGPAPLLADQLAALSDEFVWRKFFINFIFDLPRPLDLSMLQRALEHLVTVHDSLRARFVRGPAGWQQHIVAECSLPMVFAEALDCAWDDAGAGEALRAATARVHARLSIFAGPVLCAAEIADRQGARKLLFSVSHLVADGFSTLVLIEDLLETYAAFCGGASAVTRNLASIREWAPRYHAYLNSDAFQSQIEYWCSLPWSRCAPLPLDHAGGDTPRTNVAGSSRVFDHRLDESSSRAVHIGVMRLTGISPRDFLTVVLARVLMRWSGGDAISLDVHDAGRAGIQAALGVDLSRTVGAFSIRNRIFLSSVQQSDPLSEIRAMHEQLRGIPSGGAGLLPLQIACERQDIAARARRLPDAELWFNYFGVVSDRLSGNEAEDAPIPSRMSEVTRHIQAVTHDPDTPRHRVLALSGRISAGVLQFSWEYSEHLHRADTIRKLADDFQREIVSTLDAMGVRTEPLA